MASINGTKVNNAKMFDESLKKQTGITRFQECGVKEDIKKILHIIDEQEYIRRFRWYNLPSGLTSELMERILYYKGQACFFYMKENDNFYFLPYALSGNIDVYGRYMGITPLIFGGQTLLNNKDKKEKVWIKDLIKKPIYDFPLEITEDIFYNGCVLLSDRVKDISENVIPRADINKPLIEFESEIFPMLRTNLFANIGIKGMRVNDEASKEEVMYASNQIINNAMNGNIYLPISSVIEFQELNGTSGMTTPSEYLACMQSIDNWRLSTHGLKSGGLFQKNAHMLQSEANINDGCTELVFQDALLRRQEFCDMVNNIWGTSIYVEADETLSGMDLNGDGIIGSQEDQSGTQSGEQPIESEV